MDARVPRHWNFLIQCVELMPMAVPPNAPPNDYREHWSHYRTLKKLTVYVLVGWVPVMILTLLLARAYGYLMLVLPGAYLLLNYGLGIFQAFWTCPRCGKFFSNPWKFFQRGAGYPGGLAPACVNCGLPQFAPNDAAAAPSRYCTKCGTPQLDSSSKFCKKCGAPVG